MATVLLFHHALGRTEGVLGFAADLRASGHKVTVPDPYSGKTIADLDEGDAFAEVAARGCAG